MDSTRCRSFGMTNLGIHVLNNLCNCSLNRCRSPESCGLLDLKYCLIPMHTGSWLLVSKLRFNAMWSECTSSCAAIDLNRLAAWPVTNSVVHPTMRRFRMPVRKVLSPSQSLSTCQCDKRPGPNSWPGDLAYRSLAHEPLKPPCRIIYYHNNHQSGTVGKPLKGS
jgi:hypothetical protein